MGCQHFGMDYSDQAGHGNWVSEIPEVYRWPYDYGKDGRDFIPQTEPVGEEERKH